MGFARYGVVPDLTTQGKPTSNGFPIGAVVGRRDPMESFGRTARHSNTFAGNTVGIASADTILTTLQRDGIPRHAHAMGKRLRAGLETLAQRHDTLAGIRNAGLFFGIDIGAAGTSEADRRRLALDVVNAMRDDGVLISTTGANEDTLKVRPPLVCQEEHADRFIEALNVALTLVARRQAGGRSSMRIKNGQNILKLNAEW